MSLTVNHLNADSTFLLTFAPTSTPRDTSKKTRSSFTILVDPWLEGHYTVWRPGFAIAYHTQEPSISSLADVQDSIDLIVVSQDKSDHCHEETLCSLPRDTNIRILATPAAAKKIWSWKYFENPNIVQVMSPYHVDRRGTVIRIPVDPCSPASMAGEVTIANMPTKLDMSNLHNAIGITYRPPSMLTDPPISVAGSVESSLKYDDDYPSSVHLDPTGTHEKVLSVLYTPHGVSRATIQPYVANHLAGMNGALPLTALFHSLNIEANPWFMGGIVSAGAPGGAKLARALKAKYWIGAHDEIKDTSGVAVRFIRKEQYNSHRINDLLKERSDEKLPETELAILDCGEERTFVG